jgi:hypothetical protein
MVTLVMSDSLLFWWRESTRFLDLAAGGTARPVRRSVRRQTRRGEGRKPAKQQAILSAFEDAWDFRKLVLSRSARANAESRPQQRESVREGGKEVSGARMGMRADRCWPAPRRQAV